MPSEHNDPHRAGSSSFQRVCERLCSGSGGPRVIEHQRPDLPAAIGKPHGEPVALEVPSVGPVAIGHGDEPGQSKTPSDQFLERMQAGPPPRAGHSDEVRGQCRRASRPHCRGVLAGRATATPGDSTSPEQAPGRTCTNAGGGDAGRTAVSTRSAGLHRPAGPRRPCAAPDRDSRGRNRRYAHPDRPGRSTAQRASDCAGSFVGSRRKPGSWTTGQRLANSGKPSSSAAAGTRSRIASTASTSSAVPRATWTPGRSAKERAQSCLITWPVSTTGRPC